MQQKFLAYTVFRVILFLNYLFLSRSNSTGSIVSTVSCDGTSTESIHESSGPGLEAYIEAFLMVVITLNNKRKVLPQPSCGLLAQSPMADKVGTSPEERLFRVCTLHRHADYFNPFTSLYILLF